MDCEPTLTNLVYRAVAILKAAGVPDAGTDARVLVTEAARLDREDLLRDPVMALDEETVNSFDVMIGRRCNREPVSRIIGRREFRSLEFQLSPSVLDPRPESEIVVEAVLDFVRRRSGKIRVLDIGTGTGCLILSILAELPGATGIGTDFDVKAVANAFDNARRLGFLNRTEFLHTFWVDGVVGRFDVIVSNPPYIRTNDISKLSPEVSQYEPRAALDGGADGLDAYRALASRVSDHLSSSGIVITEIGAGQKTDVVQVFKNHSFKLVDARSDHAGHIRSLSFAPTG
ncbi:MAG: peptide chain release factor N(5)-glutamine methyltransferase [Pseudomonadota bacterium]|nr:peptide chain release factor N(5)-glutamine methyltransferase [Pseudomonadota bacterium]